MAHAPLPMPVMPTTGQGEVADEDLAQLGSKLRRAAANGHLLGLWQTLTLLNQHNLDEMDAHVKSIDATDENGETALTLAAMNGHARVVQVSLYACSVYSDHATSP